MWGDAVTGLQLIEFAKLILQRGPRFRLTLVWPNFCPFLVLFGNHREGNCKTPLGRTLPAAALLCESFSTASVISRRNRRVLEGWQKPFRSLPRSPAGGKREGILRMAS